MWWAVSAAGSLQIAAAVPRIRDLFLAPSDPSFRSKTATALAQIGTAPALQILYDALKSDQFEIAHSAALAFSYTRGADLDPLHRVADGDDPRLQGAAIVALGNLCDQGAYEILQRAVERAHPRVLAFAINALEKFVQARATSHE